MSVMTTPKQTVNAFVLTSRHLIHIKRTKVFYMSFKMRRIILFFQVLILCVALNVQKYEANECLVTIGVLKSEK
jgi:hypothetical protein